VSLFDQLARLRIAVFGCLGAGGLLGLCLARLDRIGLTTPIVRTTFYCFLGALSMSIRLSPWAATRLFETATRIETAGRSSTGQTITYTARQLDVASP
jgi:hypothetical protein